MGDLHEIDIRMKCIIQVVHHILVLLMKYSTKHHGDCRTKTDLNIGFAEIFTSNGKKKGLLKDHYKDYFYDPATGALRTSVIIEKLDFLVICMILEAKSKLSSLETKHCCRRACHHYCTICNPTGAKGLQCKRSVECVFNGCACGCGFEKLIHFIIVARALRNTNAHTPYQRYVDFENGKSFDNFLSCNTWRDIWKKVNDACKDCLKFLVKVKAIDSEEIKDQKMNLRIGLKKEQNFLLPIVGSFIKQYHMIILGEEDVSQKISKIEQSILNNNKLLSMDYVYLGGKLVCFEDAVVKTTLRIKSIKAQGVKFMVAFTDKIGEIVLQTKSFGSPWCFHPIQSFQWKIVVNHLMIDIFELNPDLTYSFRLLGVKEDGTLFSFSYGDFNLESLASEMFVSSQGLLIDKEIRIQSYQKTDRGIVILLPEPIPNILTVQTNIDSKWKDLEVNQYTLNESNKFELELCNLECRNQYIRCIVKKQTTDQTQVISYTLKDIDIVGRKHLCHITNNGPIVTMMHGYGAPDDLHQNISNIQHLTRPKLLSTEYQKGGGAITHSIAEADDYLSTNFPDQQSVTFPPVILDSSNDVNKLVDFLEKIYKSSYYDLKKRVIVILDESNLNQIHEITTEEDSATDQTKFCNTVVVFDGSLNLILFITCSEATDIGGLYNDHASLHNVMKSFVNNSSDLFLKNHQKQPVSLVGVLATFKLNREQVKEMNFCRSEDRLCCEMFLTTTEMEKQESFSQWYKMISRKVADNYQNRGISFVKLTNSFYCFANRLMVLLAIYDVNLPSAFGSPDTKIRTLLLNEEQMRAVNSPSKWKLITGPYGCGKTIVGQRILKKIIRQLNPDKDVIIYIISDEYSLLQNETETFCKKLEETYGVPIVCCDISQVHATRVLSDCLSEIAFGHFSNLYQTKDSIFLDGKEKEVGKPVDYTPGQTVSFETKWFNKNAHLFIDEYDSEKLTESESRRINLILQGGFDECFVVLVTQSIQKKRSYVSEEEIKILSNCIDILGETMEIVTLTKVMRFTNDILQTSEVIQKTLESNGNSYSQPSFNTIDVSAASTKKKKNGRSVNNKNAHTTKESEDSVDGNVDDIDFTDFFGRPLPNKGNVTFDRLLKITSSYTNFQSDETLSMKTEFQFYQSTGCGHGVRGKKPSVVRFQSSDIIPTTIAKAIVELADPKWRRSLYVCTDLEIAQAVYDALFALGVQIIDYLDGLLGKVPSNSRKQDVYNRWLNEVDCVLLTDNRGCRGLQHEQVVLLLDENEYYERFLLPEMIGRATSNLTLFTFNFESPPSKKCGINKRNENATIGNFVQLLLDKDLLELHSIETFPTLPNLHRAEGSSTFDREIKFSRIQCIETWKDVIFGPTQFGGSSINFAQFIDDRRIGKEKARPGTSEDEERLFKVCEHLFSENSVFQDLNDIISGRSRFFSKQLESWQLINGSPQVNSGEKRWIFMSSE